MDCSADDFLEVIRDRSVHILDMNMNAEEFFTTGSCSQLALALLDSIPSASIIFLAALSPALIKTSYLSLC